MKVIRFADMPEPKPIDTSQALFVKELTWERILEEEPQVVEIFAELRRTRPKRKRWGLMPKARLAKLVGWHARNPKLRSEAAYRMAMERMWDLLL